MLNRWQRTIVDLRGNVVPYAQLQIRVESTQATATIYADRAGNELIPNGIVTADANGYAFFYAKADLYRISSMQPTIDWRYVDIGGANAVRIATEALDENMVTYPTLAELEADTARDVNSMGRVVNDGSNNGYYLWDGTSWVRTSYQPMQRDEFDDFVLQVEDFEQRVDQNFLRKDIEQSAPLLRDIPQVGVVGLPYDVDQLYAQIWAARYPGLPAPSAYFEFGAGARILSPDLTFSRASSAWGWRNGVLVEYDVNEPVFEDGGLRLEPQGTNQIAHSNEFGEGFWTPEGGVTIDEDVGIAPDGSLAASLITSSTQNDPQGARIIDYGGTANRNKTFSIFLKSKGVRYVQINTGPNTNSRVAVFDLVEGAIAKEETHGDGEAYIQSIGNGWYRCTYSGMRSIDPGVLFLDNAEGDYNHSKPFTSGDGVIGVYVWGAQLEDFYIAPPTSYIPTHGQPETRAADQFQWTGSSFDRAFNPSQGALILRPKASTTAFSALGGWHIGLDDGKPTLRTVNMNGDTINEVQGDELDTDVRNGLGVAWTADTLTLYDNGVLIGSIPRAGTPDGLVLRKDGVLNHANMTLFSTRPTDQEMEALTHA